MMQIDLKRRRALIGMAAGTIAACLGVLGLKKAQAESVRKIEIVAQRFRFEPKVIDVKLGQPVLLQIRSLDYIHGFNVPDLGIRSDLLPGMITSVELTPLQVGRLDFLCDNFCGDDHESMHGYFNVTD